MSFVASKDHPHSLVHGLFLHPQSQQHFVCLCLFSQPYLPLTLSFCFALLGKDAPNYQNCKIISLSWSQLLSSPNSISNLISLSHATYVACSISTDQDAELFKGPLFWPTQHHIKTKYKVFTLASKVLAAQHVQLFVTHGLQPSRLLCPWKSPGKNTGMDCHSLLLLYLGFSYYVQITPFIPLSQSHCLSILQGEQTKSTLAPPPSKLAVSLYALLYLHIANSLLFTSHLKFCFFRDGLLYQYI